MLQLTCAYSDFATIGKEDYAICIDVSSISFYPSNKESPRWLVDGIVNAFHCVITLWLSRGLGIFSDAVSIRPVIIEAAPSREQENVVSRQAYCFDLSAAKHQAKPCAISQSIPSNLNIHSQHCCSNGLFQDILRSFYRHHLFSQALC